jgi:hypothetical protein
MRPIFIYNYNEGSTKKKDEFMDLFIKDADKWEDMYAADEKDAKFTEDKRSFINMLGSIGNIFIIFIDNIYSNNEETRFT